MLTRSTPLTLIFLATLIRGTSGDPTVPDGQRWQDLAGPDVLIGSLIGWGNHFPLKDRSSWKQDHREVFLRECNAGTAVCYPKSHWKGRGKFDLSRFHDSVNWLHSNGKKVVVHLLVGPMHYYDDWLRKGSFDEQEIEALLEEYIRAAITENGNADKVDVWNVVNEALYGDRPDRVKNAYRPCIWNRLGHEPDRSGLPEKARPLSRHPVWIGKAFRLARKYTDARLEYRDNNCEFPRSRHYQETYQLMAHLVKSGVPVDAFGMQLHLNVDGSHDWEGFQAQVKRMKALGLEVFVTEVDVRRSDNGEEDRARQREVYYQAVRASLEAGVTLINFWGLRDGSVGKGDNEYSLLFEDARSRGGGTYDAKPAYYGAQQALAEFAGKKSRTAEKKGKLEVRHVTVRHEKGRCFGWPANGGIWSRGNEILVQYKNGAFQDKPPGSHDIDYGQPIVLDQSRSLDGGLTWTHETTDIGNTEFMRTGEAIPRKEVPALEAPLDFSDPGTILKFEWSGYLYTSKDLGRHWHGPYRLPMFDLVSWQMRTDYLVEGPRTVRAFVSGSRERLKRDENGGMVYWIQTTDGGQTWSQGPRLSRLVNPSPDRHDVALMPSTVRVSPRKLVTCIRNLTAYPKKGWIDCRVSTDDGQTWKLASTPVGPEAGTTPPALTRLEDGRLVLTYGYRKPLRGPTSIRARISGDEGESWGEELVLRTGGGDEDIGYTVNALRPDGKIVTIYYWQENEKAERDIEATIWTPPSSPTRS